MRVLAGDIGGTKTLLGLYEVDGAEAIELSRRRFVSAQWPGLSPIVSTFLAGQRVSAAAFAIAGAVEGAIAKTTNLPWVVDQQVLSAELRAPVALLNDFAAIVVAIPQLGPRDIIVMSEGMPEPDGLVAVVGAGTGLGEALGLRSPDGMRAFASEGGHTHFAPRDGFEQGLLEFLRARLGGRVSVERVVSGPGLASIHDFIVAQGLAEHGALAAQRMQNEDPAAVIASLGSGQDPACTMALSRFLSAYGAEAGDFALKVLPRGGLYIAGGIAAKLRQPLQDGTFMTAFFDKGRMSEFLRRVPVALVTNTDTGLLGARARACMIV